MIRGRWGAAAALLALAGLAGCAPEPVPVAAGRYMVGQPYSLGGLWSYPREDFALEEAGVAAVIPDSRAGRRTANGEVFDPEAMVGAHRTLQLPAIVTVTNLETGLEVQVRVNDRGPARAGRVIGLSRRAAALLGVPEGGGGAAQVRIAVDGAASRALAAGLPAAEGEQRAIPVVAAPRGAVEAEALEPLPGARAAAPSRVVPVGAAAAGDALADPAAAGLPPERLPESVARRAAAPGRLVVEAGSFFRADLAQRQAARLGGLGARVDTVGRGRQAMHRVRLGPFATVAEADRAVAGVLAAGLPEVRLLVE